MPSELAVELVSRCREQRLPRQSYQAWARLAWLQPRSAAVAIALVDSAAMARLNRDFRDLDKPTDALAFPAGEDNALASEPGEAPLAGDIAICEEVVAAKAKERGLELAPAMAHTVVHAVLHLQGYRHHEEGAAQEMERLEADLLASIGIDDPYLEPLPR